MLIPSGKDTKIEVLASLSRRVNANSQPEQWWDWLPDKLIKKGEC